MYAYLQIITEIETEMAAIVLCDDDVISRKYFKHLGTIHVFGVTA